MMQVDSVRALTAFVHATELRSFKTAGQAMGLSASAIGKMIAKLEDQIGGRLFHRSTRSISLTHEGERFAERARRILAELELGAAEMAQVSAEPRGRLRIGLPLAGQLLTPLLAEFQRTYPMIELDLDYDNRFVDVIDDGFDAVIRTGEPSDSRLVHTKLGDFSWRLAAAPEYLERRGRPTDSVSLVGHDLLHLRFAETGKLRSWGLELPEATKLPVTVASTDIMTLVALARCGHGIASLPFFLIRDDIAEGALIEIEASSRRECGTLRLLWPRSKFPLPRISAFVTFMSERARRVLVEDL
jgi:DNA-binding transcriptional LysR family regulator